MLKDDKASLESRLHSEEEKLLRLSHRIPDLECTIRDLRTQNTRLETELHTLELDSSSEIQQVEAAHLEVQRELQNALQGLSAEREAVVDEITNHDGTKQHTRLLKSELDLFKSAASSLNNEREQVHVLRENHLSRDLEKAQSQVARRDRRIEHLNQQLGPAIAELKDLVLKYETDATSAYLAVEAPTQELTRVVTKYNHLLECLESQNPESESA